MAGTSADFGGGCGFGELTDLTEGGQWLFGSLSQTQDPNPPRVPHTKLPIPRYPQERPGESRGCNSLSVARLQLRFGLRPRNGLLRVLIDIVQTGFEQCFFLVAQRIVGIQPIVAIEFCQSKADLLPFLRGEFG